LQAITYRSLSLTQMVGGFDRTGTMTEHAPPERGSSTPPLPDDGCGGDRRRPGRPPRGAGPRAFRCAHRAGGRLRSGPSTTAPPPDATSVHGARSTRRVAALPRSCGAVAGHAHRGRYWPVMARAEVRFEAAEIGLEAFAWNIENRHLVAALVEKVAAAPALTHLTTAATSLEIEPSGVAVTLAGGAMLRCQLAVAADGRNSICRAPAPASPWTAAATRRPPSPSRSRTRVPTMTSQPNFTTAHGPFTLVPAAGPAIEPRLGRRQQRRAHASVN